ncbi:hypothetical protein [Pseudomonas sp. NPDC007930]|uniref:hypothetical protein n=1 Tax=Pseudomonas sp. NPDC007930 TaxID=3364417 RepID=UPI0036E60463
MTHTSLADGQWILAAANSSALSASGAAEVYRHTPLNLARFRMARDWLVSTPTYPHGGESIVNTFYFTKAKALMCVAACLAGLNMAPAISATTAGAQAADSSAIVHLYNGSNQDCPVIVDGEGQSAYNRSCDYSPDTVLVEKMPSTATLLISDRDCSETTGDGKQQWWV